jgi:hypothetical protein
MGVRLREIGVSLWRETMAEDSEKKDLGTGKRLSKSQAIGIMVASGVLIVLAWFIPAEQGSTFYMIKVGIGLLGFVGLCAGAYYRP